MHTSKNMVGEMKANYNVSLWKRYFRLSKHRKPGRITKSVMGAIIALEIMAGVFAYA